jgi:protein-S-isoprenylcysteine O-methyltransferase Ste14
MLANPAGSAGLRVYFETRKNPFLMPSSQNSSFAERGGWWVILQSFLMLGVLITGPLCWHSKASFPQWLAGFLLLLAGAVFGILGARSLGKSRTIFPKPLPEGELIQAGIYGIVRHPLYASLIHLSFGWALLWHCGATLVLAILLSMMLYCKCLKEEVWLRDKYPEYRDYAKRVKRFIPWVF